MESSNSEDWKRILKRIIEIEKYFSIIRLKILKIFGAV